MSIDEDRIPEKTPFVSPGNYSPVTVYMKDTIGVIFLGFLAVIFLIGWRRAESHYRALIDQQELANGNHSLDAR